MRGKDLLCVVRMCVCVLSSLFSPFPLCVVRMCVCVCLLCFLPFKGGSMSSKERKNEKVKSAYQVGYLSGLAVLQVTVHWECYFPT